MRKNIFFFFMAAAVCVASLAGSAASAGEKQISLAFVIQDLSNPTWAEDERHIRELAEELGWRMTSLDCKGNAATQISQVENLLQEGLNVLIIHPAEANALENVLQQAIAQGVKVISWDTIMENCHVGYVINNYEAGEMIGLHAANWINGNLSGRAKVAILDYPVYPELVDRANGIVAGIRKNAPDAEIVAQSSAINATEGMAKTETILMANPGIKVIACIGDGGAIGANEAVKASGHGAADFGVFSCDATQEALSKMVNDEYIRMTLSMGTYDTVARELIDLSRKLLAGEKVNKAFYRSPTPVNAGNVKEYYNK